jgi:hypothetical protein
MKRSTFLLATCLMMAAPMPLLADEKPAAAKVVTYAKVYDVREITMPIRDFPAPEIGLGKAKDAQPKNDDKDKGTSIDDLIETIESTVDPDVWGQTGFSISKFKGQLVISASREVHRKIRALLAQL